tara:strand:- start:114 stop:440 length:327 start_codon:yes stop_codon:yes gene_type:complete
MSKTEHRSQDLNPEAIAALSGVPSGFSLNRGSFDLGDEANELDRETFAQGGTSYFSESVPTNVAREATRESTRILLARAGVGLRRRLLLLSAASSAAVGAAGMIFIAY